MKKQYYIFAGAFFFSLGGNILNFSLIYRLADWFSFSPGKIGAFIALGQIFYFLGCNLYHRFGSLINPVRVFTVSASVIFIASFPLGHFRMQNLAYVSYWTLQLSTGLFWPPVMAWITEGLSEKELTREISLFNRSWMSANMAGPLIAGALYNWNSRVNFLIINLSYFLVILLFYRMRRRLPESGMKETGLPHSAPASALPAVTSLALPAAAAPAGPDEGELPVPPESRLHSPAVKALDRKLDLYRFRGWMGGFSSSLFVGVLVNIVPLHIRDGLGYTAKSAGMLLFIRCTMGFLMFGLLARFTAWHFNRRWFIFLQAGLVLCSFLFMIAGSRLFMYFTVAVVYGFVNAACYNTSLFYSGATGMNPKKNMALHEIFLCMGNAIGTAGGGFFYQHINFSGTCFVLLLVLGMGIGILVMLEKRERKA